MEGVGARFGRSSTRYGPATVFTGPVRKWKKQWIHVTPHNTTTATSNDKHHRQHQSNGNSNGNNNNASHILLYKWTPISQSHNTSANDNSNGDGKDDGAAAEEPPRRKMKYIPIAVLEEQNDDAAEDEAKAIATAAESEEKPDINDVPMEENQNNHVEVDRQEVKKSSVGLCLNLNAREGGDDSEAEEAKDQTNDGVSE